MIKTRILGATMAVALSASTALAEYPERPITYLLGFSISGAGGIMLRTFLPYMEKCLGGTILLTERAGAGGSIALTELALAKPDGYTMGQTGVPGFIAQRFGKEVKWSAESFDFIGNVSGSGSALAVRAESELKTFQDFLDKAKNSPTPLNIGVSGIGNDDHLAGRLLLERTGLNLQLIPFGGGAEARLSLLGGHVEAGLMSAGEFGANITELRPLAIASAERNAVIPDTPTFRELGYDIIMGSRQAVSGPKGLPADVLEKWRTCLAKVVVDEAFIAEAKQRGIPRLTMTAAEVEDFVKTMDATLSEMWAKDPWIK